MGGCQDHRFREMLFAYELGMLQGEALDELELHLLECEECNKEAQHLTQASGIIRHDPNIREMISGLAEEKEDSFPERVGATKKPFRIRSWKEHVSSLALVAVIIIVLIVKPWDIEIRPSLDAFAARNGIVVMPFENLCDNEDTSRLGEIATNLLITDLSESPYSRVVSGQRLNDVLSHIDTLTEEGDALVRIALETEARWAVKGSILQAEPTVVLTSQLINIETGRVEASRQAEGNEGQSIFAVVDDLAGRIKEDLNLPAQVDNEPDKRVADITTHSSEAYRCYLDGVRKRAAFYLPEADASFRRALEYDSTFAMVYYYLSLSYVGTERAELMSKAVDYSENASRREKYYIRSGEAYIRGDRDRSIAILEELVSHYPDEKEAYLDLARSESSLGHVGRAVVYLNKAIEIDPWYKDAYNRLAYLYDDLRSFDEAIQTVDRYIDIAPDEPNPYDTKGEIYLRNNKYDSAIIALQKAVEIRPDYYFSWVTLAGAYLKTREYSKAQESLDRLSDSGDRRHVLMSRLGRTSILMQQGKLDSAIMFLDSLVRTISPDQADNQDLLVLDYAHFIRASVYGEKGNYDAALKDLDASERTYSLRFPEAVFPYESSRVRLLARKGAFTEAEQCAERVKNHLEESGRELHRYWYAIASINLEKKQYKEAMINFSKASMELGFTSRYMLAVSSLEYGEVESAIEHFRSLLDDYASWTVTGNIAKAKLHYHLGRAYEKSAWYDMAIKEYQYFSDLWKNGDSDIDALSDARNRLQSLQNTTEK